VAELPATTAADRVAARSTVVVQCKAAEAAAVSEGER